MYKVTFFMHCFSGVEGLPVIGDQAVSQIKPPASLKIISPNSEKWSCSCFTKMSSCSSEVDVIKTRIRSGDDENGILYAYESNPAYVNQSVQSDTSSEEQQKVIMDVLSRCQVIQDTVENLDKKFDVMNGKVSKIYRFRAKLIWQNRRPLGYAYKHYNHLISRRIKLPKTKKDVPDEPAVPAVPAEPAVPNEPAVPDEPDNMSEKLFPASLSRSHSYSPTVPVRRPTDYQDSPMGTLYQSQDSLTQDHRSFYEGRGIRLSQSPTFPGYSSYPSGYAPIDLVQGSTSVPADMLGQGRSSPAHNHDMTYPTLLQNENLGHTASSLCMPAGFATSSSVGNDQGVLQYPYYADPADWSVEEVILFLKEVDPHTLLPLADLFREHEIDGKAMLLLHSDVMMKYMGLKLGTALKLCHYIEKLKEEKCIIDI
ncbi:sex comb on midleg-like protein 1 isoform X2 [Phyllostomus discolor]|uniref:Sex comb on midleg-like protein 1 n=1 Tax=Phyllostomus discolor TaxID=89673 RepID=A0A7E6D2A0_9CHIR|nr:sex comb on midleg-like protein 1 isoform X2 [Phyllostomus discolor]